MSVYDKIFPPRVLTLPNGKQVSKPRSRAPLAAVILVAMTALSVEVTGFDMEVLDTEKFDAEALIDKFMALPQLEGAKRPIINVLPSGSLRKFCFEKKRIRPLETREI